MYFMGDQAITNLLNTYFKAIEILDQDLSASLFRRMYTATNGLEIRIN